MTEFGLIGYPLGHSFSKTYFLKKFEAEKLDYHFELFPITAIDEFSGLLKKYPHLKGLAVTIPYKESVIPYLHKLSDEAANIGAVNCIRFAGAKLMGYNTDVIGFEKSFTPGLQPQHTKALVLGTGGSSKAITYVLSKLGINYKLVSRKRIDSNSAIVYSEIDHALLEEYSIIINCSPVGMFPNENNKPDIPYQFISSQHYLFDLVYKPSETMFLKEGRNRGAQVKNGFEMLVLQAEENWKIWNDGL
jgi:shikimate dehydrogenase